MPFVRDYTTQELAAETGTTLAVTLPRFEVGDLLIIFGANDVGNGTLTMASANTWTDQTVGGQQQNNSFRSCVFQKVSVADEPDPVLTSTITDGLGAICLAIGGFDTSDVFNLETVTHASSTSAPVPAAGSTTSANELVIYAVLGDDNDGIAYISADNTTASDFLRFAGRLQDDTADVSLMVGYRNQPVAGAIVVPVYKREVADGTDFYVFSINDSGGATLVPRLGSTLPANLETFISNTPMGFYTFFEGSSFLPATIDGDNVLSGGSSSGATSGALENVSYRGIRGISGSRNWVTVGIDYTGDIQDLTDILLSFTVSTIDLVDRFGTMAEVGVGFVAVDSLGSYKIWGFDGKDGPGDIRDHVQVFLDVSTDQGLYVESGTLDITDIEYLGLIVHNTRTTGTAARGFLSHMETTDLSEGVPVIGGSAEFPTSFSEIAKVLQGHSYQNSVSAFGTNRTQGLSQTLLRQCVSIGDGVSDVYFDASGESLEFPGPYSLSSVQLTTLIDPDRLGLFVDATAGSTISFTFCIINSEQPWRFEVKATSSTSAAYSFQGAQFFNAGICKVSPVPDVKGASFFGCTSVDGTATNFEDTVFSEPVGGEAVQLGSANTLKNVEFIVADAADIPIKLTALGSYTFDNVSFAGVAPTDRVEIDSAITTGTVTINLNNGSGLLDAQVVRDVGVTVTIVDSPVTLTIDVKKPDGSVLSELNARVYVTAAAGGALSVGTVIISELTDILGQAADTRSYASNQPITGYVRKHTASPFYKQANILGTIDSSTGLSLSIQLVSDE